MAFAAIQWKVVNDVAELLMEDVAHNVKLCSLHAYNEFYVDTFEI